MKSDQTNTKKHTHEGKKIVALSFHQRRNCCVFMQICTLWLYLLLAIKTQNTHTLNRNKKRKTNQRLHTLMNAPVKCSYLKQYQLVVRRKLYTLHQMIILPGRMVKTSVEMEENNKNNSNNNNKQIKHTKQQQQAHTENDQVNVLYTLFISISKCNNHQNQFII